MDFKNILETAENKVKTEKEIADAANTSKNNLLLKTVQPVLDFLTYVNDVSEYRFNKRTILEQWNTTVSDSLLKECIGTIKSRGWGKLRMNIWEEHIHFKIDKDLNINIRIQRSVLYDSVNEQFYDFKTADDCIKWLSEEFVKKRDK